MNDEQLLRYSRQILLDQVDIAGQQRILDSRALIIGQGGLGSPIGIYLAAAGVGQLVLVDDDTVDLTNLQRQIVHTTDRVGESKVASAAMTLHALNPGPELITFDRRLNDDELREQVAAADVVIDGTDNFSSRIQVNRLCVEMKTPLVWGAAVRLEGQVSVYHPEHPADGCYQCLYRHDDYPTEQCREMGVFTPVVGIIGTVQANEALKILAGFGDTLHGRLLLLDAARMEWMCIKLAQRADCPVCAIETKL